jgi:hypothetical protein
MRTWFWGGGMHKKVVSLIDLNSWWQSIVILATSSIQHVRSQIIWQFAASPW